jgi:hypothetical protein
MDRMRKQYHFWPGARRLDAWDVDRLVALSAALPVEEVRLASIGEFDSEYWFGDGFPPPTVREIAEHARLIAAVDLSYPVILGPDGRVMDGMHRIARAFLEGRLSVPALRLPQLPEPDYRDCLPGELPY